MDFRQIKVNASPDTLTQMLKTEVSDQKGTSSPQIDLSVAVIIPAFNEEERIGQILSILRQTVWVTEIIVVDDGSQDHTAAQVQQAAELDPRLHLIRHELNQGKGQAIFTAWQSTSAKTILMLDADLSNFKPEHAWQLAEPVIHDRAEMTVGLFRRGKLASDLSHFATPWLSGQRCFQRQLLNWVPTDIASGYGFETAISLIAREHGWRLKRVYLHGVYHPPNEIHRGVWSGIRNRARMYIQIIKTWRMYLKKRTKKRRFPFPLAILLLLLTVMLGPGLVYDRLLVRSGLTLKNIPMLPLNSFHRILVIAPHPDDEVLGTGGLIEQALAQDSEVRVVVITNGDGQVLAPVKLEMDAFPHPKDYIDLGKRRQQESLAGLAEIGVPLKNVYYLGYPDGGLYNLWLSDWTSSTPLTARFTRVTSSPYPLTYNPHSTYIGKSPLDDLFSILKDFQPDLIVIPHPNDEHPDHDAASNYTRLAVSILATENPGASRPVLWGYLVHYGYYPQPRGQHLNLPMLPPGPMSHTANVWGRVDLTPEQVKKKLEAIKQYKTQINLLGSFLESFARPNELFADLPIVDILPLSYSSYALGEKGLVRAPVLPEPASESTRKALIGGADLVGWQTLRINDTLCFWANTRGRMLSGLDYRVYVKIPSGTTRTVNTSSAVPIRFLDRNTSPEEVQALSEALSKTQSVNPKPTSSGISAEITKWFQARPKQGTPSQNELAMKTLVGNQTFGTCASLLDLGEPSVLGFYAEVRQGMVLDRTAWHFIIVQDH